MRYEWMWAVSLLVSLALVQGHILEIRRLQHNSVRHQNKEDQEVYLRKPPKSAVTSDSLWNGRFRRSFNTSMTAGYDWNSVIDIIFSAAQREILAQGKDKINVPDAVKEFERTYGFLKVKGRFTAKEGTLSNLTDFRRSGDVSVVKINETTYEMTCLLSLDNLLLRYDKYELKVLGMRVHGSLEGTVTSNTVRMTLNFVRTEEGCLSTLKAVNLTDLAGLKVTLTGLREFNGLGSAVATLMVQQQEKDIVAIVNRVFKREIERALDEFQCDEYAILLFL